MYEMRGVRVTSPAVHASRSAASIDTKYLYRGTHELQARNTSVCTPLEIYEFADARMRDEHTH